MPTKVPITATDHVQGNSSTAVMLIEYADYQCPQCDKAHFVVKKLQEHYGSQLAFVFRNFPLAELHPYAEPAAEVAEFAAEHGLFWEMHDLIYENQDVLSIPLLFELTERLGLPTNDLNSIIERKAYHHKIRSDFMGGVRAGVNGTPTFFINEQRYNGPFEFEDLMKAIDPLLI